jgi:hypothetical protein
MKNKMPNGIKVYITGRSKYLPGSEPCVVHHEEVFRVGGDDGERDTTFIFNLWDTIRKLEIHNHVEVQMSMIYVSDEEIEKERTEYNYHKSS